MDTTMYTAEQQGDVTILTFTNQNFLHDDNEELMKSFEGILAKQQKKIILDFVNCGYISSLILASLVYFHNQVKDKGGALIFCNVKDRVKEIVEMTRLDKVFNLVATKDDAIAKIGKKG